MPRCLLNSFWVEAFGRRELSEAVKQSSSLTKLDLSYNECTLPYFGPACTHFPAHSGLSFHATHVRTVSEEAGKSVPPRSKAFGEKEPFPLDARRNRMRFVVRRYFGDMLSKQEYLLDVNLKWNALKADGGRAVAKGLESNQVLRTAICSLHVHELAHSFAFRCSTNSILPGMVLAMMVLLR